LAYYVDIVRQYLRNILNNDRYSSVGAGALSDGLWRRASAAGASTPLEKRAFGIADDMQVFFFLFYINMQVFFFLFFINKNITHIYMYLTKQLWSWSACCIHGIYSILRSRNYGWHFLAGD